MDATNYRDQADTMDANDRNYCVPVALGLVSGRPAKEISDSLIAKGRRKFGKGVFHWDWKAELTDMGVGYTDVTDKYLQGRGITVKTLGTLVDPNRKFLVRIGGHLLAIVNGSVEDWTRGRKHKVKEVLEITENGVAVSAFTPKGRGQGRDTNALETLREELSGLINDRIDGYGTWAIDTKITGSWVKVSLGEYRMALLVSRKGGEFNVALQADRCDSRHWIGKWVDENLNVPTVDSKSYRKLVMTSDELVMTIQAAFDGEC